MNVPKPNYDEINKEVNNISVIYSLNQINPQITIPQPIILGSIAQQAYCPICKQQVQTQVKYVVGIHTWLSFFLFMIFGIICGIFFLVPFLLIIISWIPLCIKTFKDCKHYCSECNNYIGIYKRVRKAAIFCSSIFTLLGIGLSIAAILKPSWQVVNIQEYISIHEHGLWLDCIRHSRYGNSGLIERYSTINEPLHCMYKFDYEKYSKIFDREDDNTTFSEVNRHKFHGWHMSTLIILVIALITSFLSVCLAVCGCCCASLSLLFTTTTFLTILLSSVAEGIFFFFSHQADNRFIKGIVATYEQHVGLAFFLQMAACLFHFIAFLFAILATYFAFSQRRVTLDQEHHSLQNSSKTNNTNMGRSIEIELPVFVQQSPTIKSQKSLAPYLLKEKEGKDVDNSMPEILK